MTAMRLPVRPLASLALLAVLAFPPTVAVPMVPTLADVAYGSYADPDDPHSAERLDLYAHLDAVAPQPVLIEVHQGGFSKGTKSEFEVYLPDEDGVDAIAKAFDAGFAVVSIDYPLAVPSLLEDGQPNPEFPKNRYPRAAHSVRRAIQFVRSMAGEWNLDPERVFLIGNSAGGNLSLWTAMTKDVAKPGSSHPVKSQSSRPDGVVFLSAPTSLDPAHLLLPAGETEIADYLGKKSAAALAKAPKKARAASPAWRATHKGGGLATSDALAQLNASMPLLGVYVDEDSADSVTLPVGNPHNPVFGVLMQEALDAWAAESQDPQAQWEDFTLLGVAHKKEAQAADAVVAWLMERAGMTVPALGAVDQAASGSPADSALR
jgi:poly(3-hydroxybutyrate) depolymerase